MAGVLAAARAAGLLAAAVVLVDVAQARRSASFSETPRFS
jgi:hypothetical protein